MLRKGLSYRYIITSTRATFEFSHSLQEKRQSRSSPITESAQKPPSSRHADGEIKTRGGLDLCAARRRARIDFADRAITRRVRTHNLEP